MIRPLALRLSGCLRADQYKAIGGRTGNWMAGVLLICR
jgi:hypothetical protein